jgi:hypothetical protein
MHRMLEGLAPEKVSVSVGLGLGVVAVAIAVAFIVAGAECS